VSEFGKVEVTSTPAESSFFRSLSLLHLCTLDFNITYIPKVSKYGRLTVHLVALKTQPLEKNSYSSTTCMFVSWWHLESRGGGWESNYVCVRVEIRFLSVVSVQGLIFISQPLLNNLRVPIIPSIFSNEFLQYARQVQACSFWYFRSKLCLDFRKRCQHFKFYRQCPVLSDSRWKNCDDQSEGIGYGNYE
jgi:hypothetical protein